MVYLLVCQDFMRKIEIKYLLYKCRVIAELPPPPAQPPVFLRTRAGNAPYVPPYIEIARPDDDEQTQLRANVLEMVLHNLKADLVLELTDMLALQKLWYPRACGAWGPRWANQF